MKIASDRLTGIVSTLLQSAGADEREAGLVAEYLVAAELRGTPSHGVNLLPAVFARIDAGHMEVPTRLK